MPSSMYRGKTILQARDNNEEFIGDTNESPQTAIDKINEKYPYEGVLKTKLYYNRGNSNWTKYDPERDAKITHPDEKIVKPPKKPPQSLQRSDPEEYRKQMKIYEKELKKYKKQKQKEKQFADYSDTKIKVKINGKNRVKRGVV